MNQSYLHTVDSEWFRQRISGVIYIICAAFVVLMMRLFFLQVVKGKDYLRLSETNSIRLKSIEAPRGLIYDRNGYLLVDNRPSFNVSLIPKDAKPVEKTIETLSHHVQTPKEGFLKKLDENRTQPSFKPVALLQDISRDTLGVVEAHIYELPGIAIEVASKRHYIQQLSASHLLGYLGEINKGELMRSEYSDRVQGDFIGKSGVEKVYENYLAGQRGGQQVEVNAMGRIVNVLKTVDSRPGNDIFLTIDYDLQKKAEFLFQGSSGAAVAMDPQTGEILVFLSSPAFDQNIFVSGMTQVQWNSIISNPYRPLQNKVIQAEYPPASTYKIITAMAALEEGVVDERTTVHCPGYYRFGNQIFRCWKKGGHGRVNIEKALIHSCDVFFYIAGQELGVDRIAYYAMKAGLGSPTGVELLNESKGLIPTKQWKEKRFKDKWHRGETLSVAIGQGYNLVTPIQMAALIGAIGNQGIRVRPSVLRRVQSPEGTILFEQETKVADTLPVSKKTLDIIRKSLWQVVNTPWGTAYRSRLKEVEICGKTGTAQIVGRKKDNKDMWAEEDLADQHKSHAWFVAYAPPIAPKIAVAVIVEHGEHGSTAAAPIASEIIKDYFLKIDVNQKEKEKEEKMKAGSARAMGESQKTPMIKVE